MTNNQQPDVKSGTRLNTWFSFLVVSLISIVLNFALHENVRAALRIKYPNDSFYTLSVPEALGLALITTTLLLCILMASWFTTLSWTKKCCDSTTFFKGFFLLLNILFILAVYQVFLSIAPQIFYTYYQFIFTDLPLQWVIKPITVELLLDRISLGSDASIAQHLAGFTLWVLMLNAVMQWLSHAVLAKRTT